MSDTPEELSEVDKLLKVSTFHDRYGRMDISPKDLEILEFGKWYGMDADQIEQRLAGLRSKILVVDTGASASAEIAETLRGRIAHPVMAVTDTSDARDGLERIMELLAANTGPGFVLVENARPEDLACSMAQLRKLHVECLELKRLTVDDLDVKLDYEKPKPKQPFYMGLPKYKKRRK